MVTDNGHREVAFLAQYPALEHLHMLTHFPHQTLSTPPAPMDTKFNTQRPGGSTSKPSFAPVTACHRATQKSFRPPKRGCWGALHVGIAWRIYHHKQLKKMQQEPDGLNPELPLKYPEQHRESDQPSCTRPTLDSPDGSPGKTSVHVSRRSSPSSPSDPSAKLPKVIPKEEEEEEEEEEEGRTHRQIDTAKDPHQRDPSRDQTVTSDPWPDRIRPLGCDSVTSAKRLNREVVGLRERCESSKTLLSCLSQFGAPRPSHSLLHPYNDRSSISHFYTRAKIHPYQTAPSWEQMRDGRARMDLRSRQNSLKDNYVDVRTAIRPRIVAQRQREALRGFSTQPCYVPFACVYQDTVCLCRREFVHLTQQSAPPLHFCQNQLPHPGYVAASYLGH